MKKEFNKIESRLKCISSKISQMGEAYNSFVDDKSKEDFEKLVNLRGAKKSEIDNYDKII